MERSLERCGAWLEEDLPLLRDPGGFRPRVARPELEVGSRPMPDDPNWLFRWRLPVVEAPAAVVFEGFVHRLLEHHREWTREFTGGEVLPSPAPGVRLLTQRFEPGVPGVAPRDLCCAEVTRALPGGALQASYRSVDLAPRRPGFERIDWWGAVLCTPRGEGQSELVYLDRENQGGRFPAWLMNRMMTRYLVVQAEAVQRFFADGGPEAVQEAAGTRAADPASSERTPGG